jgi:uncharacterized membrane protein YgcG
MTHKKELLTFAKEIVQMPIMAATPQLPCTPVCVCARSRMYLREGKGKKKEGGRKGGRNGGRNGGGGGGGERERARALVKLNTTQQCNEMKKRIHG